MNKKFKRYICTGLALALACACRKESAPEKEKVYDYLLTISEGFLTKDKSSYEPVNVSECVTLPDYRNFKYEAEYVDVTADEVNAAIAEAMQQFTYRELLEDAVKVEEGDTLLIDLLATADSQIDESASLRDYEYTLGGGIRDELEERLVGLTVGNTYDIPVKLSENFPVSGYENKSFDYELHIKAKVRYVTPELDDEYAVKLQAADKDSYVNSLWSNMRARRMSEYEEKCSDALYKRICDETVIKSFDENERAEASDQLYRRAQTQYKLTGFTGTFEEFLASKDLNKDSFRKLCDEGADAYVKEKLMVLAIAKQENITVSKDEFDEVITDYLSKYGLTSDQFIKALGSNETVFVTERCYEVIQKKIKKYLFDTYWHQ